MLLSEARPRPFRQHPNYRKGADSRNTDDISDIGTRYPGYYANRLETKNREFLKGLDIYKGKGYVNADESTYWLPEWIVSRILLKVLDKVSPDCNSVGRNTFDAYNDRNTVEIEFAIPISEDDFYNFNKEDRGYINKFIEEELYNAVYSLNYDDTDVAVIKSLYEKLANLLGTEDYEYDAFDDQSLDFYVLTTKVDKVYKDKAVIKALIQLPYILDKDILEKHADAINANPAAFRTIIQQAFTFAANNLGKAISKLQHYEFGRLFSNH